MALDTLRTKFSLFQTNPFLAYFLAMSVSVFVMGCISYLFSYIFTAGTALADATAVKHDSKSILELHIANDGLIFLQGVTVVSVSDTNIKVNNTWQKFGFDWTVETNESYVGTRHFGTNFLDSKGKNIPIADIQPGDIITVSGTLDTNQTQPTIKADVVRTRL